MHIQGVTHPMSPAVTASMEESGEVTSHVRDKAIKGKNVGVGVGAGAVTRGVAVGGGIKSGRSKTRIQHEVVTTDDRQLYITVSGQGWADVAKVPATEGEKARRFVAATNAAAANFEHFSGQHERHVSAARSALAAAKADTGAMNQAIAAREGLGPDPLREALARPSKSRALAP